jgi:glycosyltransferase involved in cell wall biosynthesis
MTLAAQLVMTIPQLTEQIGWLRDFEARNGRKLRVLHVGNICNNAYLAAKFLRRAGVDADVLCCNYYHIMGTPEWEELDIQHDWHDDYRPRFAREDIGDYQRPDWFVQGPLKLCAAYLIARNRGDRLEAVRLWSLLETIRTHDSVSAEEIDREAGTILKSPGVNSWNEILKSNSVAQGVTKSCYHLQFFLRRMAVHASSVPFLAVRRLWLAFRAALRGVGLREVEKKLVQWALRRKIGANALQLSIDMRSVIDPPPYVSRFNVLISEFALLFPSRPDKLTLADLTSYQLFVEILESAFKDYDIVQGYSTDPIWPLICGKKPYFAFEHGTLREYIRGDSLIHRLTALAYRKADHVFITNGDCLEHAQWLGVKHMSAMLHPTDVEQHEVRDEAAIAALRRKYGADVLLFCPFRHDWAAKGTDVHIRALPRILELLPGRVRLLLAPWGTQIEESRALIKELNCEHAVIWLERPLCRIGLIRHLQAADVVLDQMALPHFGGTAPQALAAGSPVVMSYRPESTEWIIKEPAPILPAFTPSEVADAVVTARDPVWLEDFRRRARSWVHDHHHHDRVAAGHLMSYRRVLENTHGF